MKTQFKKIVWITACLYMSCCPTPKLDVDQEPLEPHDASIVAGVLPEPSTEPPPATSGSSAKPSPIPPKETTEKTYSFSFKKPGAEWARIPFASLASFENIDGDQMHFTADRSASLKEAVDAISKVIKEDPKPKYRSKWTIDNRRHIAECSVAWPRMYSKMIIRFFPKMNIALAGIAASETVEGIQKTGFLTRDLVRSAKIRPATPEEEERMENDKKQPSEPHPIYL